MKKRRGKLYTFDKDKCIAALEETGYPISVISLSWINELNGTLLRFHTDYELEEVRHGDYIILKSWCKEVTGNV